MCSLFVSPAYCVCSSSPLNLHIFYVRFPILLPHAILYMNRCRFNTWTDPCHSQIDNSDNMMNMRLIFYKKKLHRKGFATSAYTYKITIYSFRYESYNMADTKGNVREKLTVHKKTNYITSHIRYDTQGIPLSLVFSLFIEHVLYLFLYLMFYARYLRLDSPIRLYFCSH